MILKIIRGAFLNPFELQNFYGLEEGNDVEVISSKRPLNSKINLPLKKLWSPADLPNFPFKYPILNRLFIDGQILFGLEKAITGADIVHVAETYFGYTYQAIMAKRKGMVKKVITTVWETIPFNNQSLRGRRMVKIYAKENIDHFIAVTERAKKSLIKEGIKEEKITVIPMGVDLKKFKPRPKLKNKRDVNILCVARLVPEKGVLTLLKAFLHIRKRNKNVILTFVGDGPLKQDLKGYKGVFVKRVPYHKMPDEYSSADIFCLPSQTTATWEEQFGMCLVEAMASGLPIVSTKTGAIPEVCGGIASLVAAGNSHSLAVNLEKLIYNKDLREKMGIDSQKRAEEHFDQKQIAEQINHLYQKILCR
jgi:glycosyltransferase involved in cell wall biosynthesis